MSNLKHTYKKCLTWYGNFTICSEIHGLEQVWSVHMSGEWNQGLLSVKEDDSVPSIQEVFCRSRSSCSCTEVIHKSDSVYFKWDRGSSWKYSLLFARIYILSLPEVTRHIGCFFSLHPVTKSSINDWVLSKSSGAGFAMKNWSHSFKTDADIIQKLNLTFGARLFYYSAIQIFLTHLHLSHLLLFLIQLTFDYIWLYS